MYKGQTTLDDEDGKFPLNIGTIYPRTRLRNLRNVDVRSPNLDVSFLLLCVLHCGFIQ
jgi:hypothetical protein